MARMALNLALQGGGAHGAFTWGVLDRLLEESTLDLGWISATSAGAVNAVALASGLAKGGRDGARQTLKAVWEEVQKAGAPELARLNPILYGFTRAAFGSMAGVVSPYDFNPLGVDPLRRLLEAQVDFAAIRDKPGPELLIAATLVATGMVRHFRRREITVEAVLASACLPTVHHAVMIDGMAYWDGGFSANPSLLPLIDESPVRDTLLVMLTPKAEEGLPRTAREIAGTISRITFNQPLLRDIEAIVDRRKRAPRQGFLARWRSSAPEGGHRLHLIEAGRYTATLSAESKMKPDPELMMHLYNAGRTEAAKWLDRHARDVGHRETVDLEGHFLTRSGSMACAGGAGEAEVPARHSQGA